MSVDVVLAVLVLVQWPGQYLSTCVVSSFPLTNANKYFTLTIYRRPHLVQHEDGLLAEVEGGDVGVEVEPDHLVEGDVARELLILGAGGAVVGELLLDDRLATQRINVKAEWRLWLLELSTGLCEILWCQRKP